MNEIKTLNPFEAGEEVVNQLFQNDYWNLPVEIVSRPQNIEARLTTKETKLTAATFEQGVRGAITGSISGIELPSGSELCWDHYRVGSLVLYDLETIRKGVTSASGRDVDIDLSYPGQVRRVLNADALDLINLCANKANDDRFWPARLKLHSPNGDWQYSRVSWFGMIAPTKDKETNAIKSFGSAANEGVTKALFQSPFGISDEMLARPVVGQTLQAVVKDFANNDVLEYQRLRSATIFPQTADWLSKEVYKHHYSSKRLGRRAISGLSSACLVRNSK